MQISRRPLLPGEVDFERWLVWLIPGSWLAAWLLLFILPVRMPPCPVHHFTGIPCPGCGSSRATVSLAHGDLLEALNFNPAWTFACLSGIALWLYCLTALASGKLRLRPGTISALESWILRLGLVLVMLLNWGWVFLREYAHK